MPENTGPLHFVHLSGDRLYTTANETLYVYSMIEFTSPTATYQLGIDEWCYKGLIIDNRLYLGGNGRLHIFEVTPSLAEPLRPITNIATKTFALKILRVGNDLLLG